VFRTVGAHGEAQRRDSERQDGANESRPQERTISAKRILLVPFADEALLTVRMASRSRSEDMCIVRTQCVV
jgi:hypothetical protein